jgi:prevent-host-death family protein
MTTIGVRELRQNASEILREVEAGTPATVTVSGRAVAQIVPIRGDRWATWEQVRGVFSGAVDPTLAGELRSFGEAEVSDPWER